MFYLSNYLEAHRDEYLARLREFGQLGAWDRWIGFFRRALVEQAESNAKPARAIIELYEHMKTQIIDLTHSNMRCLCLIVSLCSLFFRVLT